MNCEASSLRNRHLDGHILYVQHLDYSCAKVMHVMGLLGLKIEIRSIYTKPEYLDELAKGGGSLMVPCLRIEAEGGTQWMHDSKVIIGYLRSL